MQMRPVTAMQTFQFTTSQGGRLFGGFCRGFPSTFQFTTSQGGRLFPPLRTFFPSSFNSRPLKEVDVRQRMTGMSRIPFNSRPLKEVDSQGLVKTLILRIFQFTTSQGGRPRTAGCRSRRESLSIHDLSRRSTRR